MGPLCRWPRQESLQVIRPPESAVKPFPGISLSGPGHHIFSGVNTRRVRGPRRSSWRPSQRRGPHCAGVCATPMADYLPAWKRLKSLLRDCLSGFRHYSVSGMNTQRVGGLSSGRGPHAEAVGGPSLAVRWALLCWCLHHANCRSVSCLRASPLPEGPLKVCIQLAVLNTQRMLSSGGALISHAAVAA